MYFSFQKDLSADATVTGNDKNIIKAVGYKHAVWRCDSKSAICVTVVFFLFHFPLLRNKIKAELEMLVKCRLDIWIAMNWSLGLCFLFCQRRHYEGLEGAQAPPAWKGMPCNSAISEEIFIRGYLRLHYYYLIVTFLYNQKCAKMHLQQRRNSKNVQGRTSGPRFKVSWVKGRPLITYSGVSV